MKHMLRISLACATVGLAFPASALDPGSVDRKLVSRDNNVQIEVLSQGRTACAMLEGASGIGEFGLKMATHGCKEPVYL